LKDRRVYDSTVYGDQILLKPIQQFWEEAFEDFDEPTVMEIMPRRIKRSAVLLVQISE
jgi:hypothetical protein